MSDDLIVRIEFIKSSSVSLIKSNRSNWESNRRSFDCMQNTLPIKPPKAYTYIRNQWVVIHPFCIRLHFTYKTYMHIHKTIATIYLYSTQYSIVRETVIYAYDLIDSRYANNFSCRTNAGSIPDVHIFFLFIEINWIKFFLSYIHTKCTHTNIS